MIVMKDILPTEQIAALLRNLSQPDRIRILQTIGAGEACVCHLEAHLGLRQAYLSQHLMALRKARILKSRRAGRYIFYRLANTELLDLIQMAGQIMGVSKADLDSSILSAVDVNCPCPHCEDRDPQNSGCCSNTRAEAGLIEVH